VHKLTNAPAQITGLVDRGVLAAGQKADLNVIDLDRLGLHPPEIRYDLPAGGRRLVQRSSGYVATLVAGQVVSREGTPSGTLPGQLVRVGQGARAAG
jgi:N-acyl-D-aspartate/D-glutamate deacylase